MGDGTITGGAVRLRVFIVVFSALSISHGTGSGAGLAACLNNHCMFADAYGVGVCGTVACIHVLCRH
jgi:hypothetical protein